VLPIAREEVRLDAKVVGFPKLALHPRNVSPQIVLPPEAKRAGEVVDHLMRVERPERLLAQVVAPEQVEGAACEEAFEAGSLARVGNAVDIPL
jgi:hypothetical protein